MPYWVPGTPGALPPTRVAWNVGTIVLHEEMQDIDQKTAAAVNRNGDTVAGAFTWSGATTFSGALTLSGAVSTSGAWTNTGAWTWNNTVTVLSGGALTVNSGATMTSASVTGLSLTGTQPASTADPGANNLALATNQVKAWGCVTVGNNVFTLHDGYNIASMAASDGSTKTLVTFARAMANDDYAVVYGSGEYTAYPITPKTDLTTTTFKIALIDTSTFSGTPLGIGGGSTTYNLYFMVIGRQ